MRITLGALRARSKEERQMIATLSSFAVMSVLLVGWGVASLGVVQPRVPGDVSQTAAAAGASAPTDAGAAAVDTDAATRDDAFAAPQPGVATSSVETGTVVTIPADSN